jgi:cholesterol oxidase
VTVSAYQQQPTHRERARRRLRAPGAVVHDVATSDGVPLLLTRYRGGPRGPVLLAHGLGTSSRIFSTETIGTNLVEFLCARGFDVWLADLRVSIDLPSATQRSTGDDVATKDFPALVATIRYVTGAKQLDAIVHCYGATTLFMSVLAGLAGVRSIIASQAAAHAVVPWRLRLEASARLATMLSVTGLRSVSTRVNATSSVDRALDSVLAAMAVPAERCASATCRRVSLVYGRVFRHEQLTPETHDALPDLFGSSNLGALEHMAAIVRRGRLVSATGRDDYLGHVERLALPVTFIHGALNERFLPASTAATYAMLCAKHGAKRYDRHVIAGYGHMDCIIGKSASTEVYPLMLRHLERVSAASPPAAPITTDTRGH